MSSEIDHLDHWAAAKHLSRDLFSWADSLDFNRVEFAPLRDEDRYRHFDVICRHDTSLVSLCRTAYQSKYRKNQPLLVESALCLWIGKCPACRTIFLSFDPTNHRHLLVSIEASDGFFEEFNDDTADVIRSVGSGHMPPDIAADWFQDRGRDDIADELRKMINREIGEIHSGRTCVRVICAHLAPRRELAMIAEDKIADRLALIWNRKSGVSPVWHEAFRRDQARLLREITDARARESAVYRQMVLGDLAIGLPVKLPTTPPGL